MYIKRLSVQNFKGIEHREITFEKGFNLLIGDNGVGKTSILEAVSVALGGYLSGLDDVTAKGITKDEIRILEIPMGEGSFERQYETPVTIECVVDVDGKEYTWSRCKSSVKASRSTVEPRTICKVANQMAKDPDKVLPILNYQSAARTWMQKREQTQNVFKSDYNRTVAYRNCLDEASDPKMLLNWCAKMEQVSWQKEKPIAEYESVKNALSTFMSVMNGGGKPRIRFDKQQSELAYVEGGESLPIRCLSAGYQSLIWMVLDIAYRMSVLNPNLLDHTTETDGIVLIDELDMHLHPKWQWNVIHALQETFPNVQFIAATHSPILIGSCRNGKLIDVRQDGVSDLPMDFGLGVNDVLTYKQGSVSMVQEVQDLLNQIYDNMDDGQL